MEDDEKIDASEIPNKPPAKQAKTRKARAAQVPSVEFDSTTVIEVGTARVQESVEEPGRSQELASAEQSTAAPESPPLTEEATPEASQAASEAEPGAPAESASKVKGRAQRMRFGRRFRGRR